MASMASIEQFKMATGYYDEGAILQAAGVAEREARFADIFGDAQGAHEIATEYQALLDEARRLNRAMLDTAQGARAAEIAAALDAQDWTALVRLGAARLINDDGVGRYELTLPAADRDPYGDQAGIDG